MHLKDLLCHSLTQSLSESVRKMEIQPQSLNISHVFVSVSMSMSLCVCLCLIYLNYLGYLNYLVYLKYIKYCNFLRYLGYLRNLNYIWYFNYLEYFKYLEYLKYIRYLNYEGYCHTRLHLGFSAKLRIEQESSCKMEPRSGIIFGQDPTRPDTTLPDPTRLPDGLVYLSCYLFDFDETLKEYLEQVPTVTVHLSK